VGFLFIEAQHWVMQTRQFANLKRRIAHESTHYGGPAPGADTLVPNAH
jgi:hypothetical protein